MLDTNLDLMGLSDFTGRCSNMDGAFSGLTARHSQ